MKLYFTHVTLWKILWLKMKRLIMVRYTSKINTIFVRCVVKTNIRVSKIRKNKTNINQQIFV